MNNLKQDFNNLFVQTIITGFFLIISYFILFTWFDTSIIAFFKNNFQGTFFFTISNYIGIIFSKILWIGIFIFSFIYIFYLIFTKNNNAKIKKQWLILSCTIFITLVVVTLLKIIIGRARPEMFFHYGDVSFHYFSMQKLFHSSPSGHAALSFAGFLAIASFFSKNKIWLILAVIFAVLISISRLIISKHYLSDVILGGYIGIFAYLWANYIIGIFYKNNKKL